MRIKRSQQLWPSNGTVHLYWRCHNKEYYLDNHEFKNLYLKCLEESLGYKQQGDYCKIHSFSAMGNHFHQSVSYIEGSENLSKFMRYTHSIFGARYNKINKRSGKVAEGRPKTPLVQNDFHAMRLHFYIEANPIRAGIRTFKNLKNYIYSSFGFYAYGLKTKFSHILTIPSWYLALGDTIIKRQRKYRKLFKKYLGIEDNESSQKFKNYYIGDRSWINEALLKIKKFTNLLIESSSLNSLQNSS